MKIDVTGFTGHYSVAVLFYSRHNDKSDVRRPDSPFSATRGFRMTESWSRMWPYSEIQNSLSSALRDRNSGMIHSLSSNLTVIRLIRKFNVTWTLVAITAFSSPCPVHNTTHYFSSIHFITTCHIRIVFVTTPSRTRFLINRTHSSWLTEQLTCHSQSRNSITWILRVLKLLTT